MEYVTVTTELGSITGIREVDIEYPVEYPCFQQIDSTSNKFFPVFSDEKAGRQEISPYENPDVQSINKAK